MQEPTLAIAFNQDKRVAKEFHQSNPSIAIIARTATSARLSAGCIAMIDANLEGRSAINSSYAFKAGSCASHCVGRGHGYFRGGSGPPFSSHHFQGFTRPV